MPDNDPKDIKGPTLTPLTLRPSGVLAVERHDPPAAVAAEPALHPPDPVLDLARPPPAARRTAGTVHAPAKATLAPRMPTFVKRLPLYLLLAAAALGVALKVKRIMLDRLTQSDSSAPGAR